MNRTRSVYLVFLLALASQRLWEVRISQRHAARLLAAGGLEHAPRQYQLMKVLHASWFVAIWGEVIAKQRRFRPALAWPAALLFVTRSVRCCHSPSAPRWTRARLSGPATRPSRTASLPAPPELPGGRWKLRLSPPALGVVGRPSPTR